jgi:glycosyltransferase EpsF
MSAPRPLKVLQVLHSLSMGGAETWLMELMRHWSKSGAVQMHFLATGGVRGAFDDEVVALGGRIHYLRYGRAHMASFLPAYRRLLRRERYDAVHDHADYASGWHFLLGAGVLPPVRVAHVHNPPLHLHSNYAVSPLRKAIAGAGRGLVLGLATHVCGTSAKALADYGFDPGLARPKVSVLHCGFDVGAFNGPRDPDRRSVLAEFDFPADAKVALFAGRLDRDFELGHPRNHKNSWLAALIARAAAERDPRFHLLMAGAGDDQRAELERRIDAWGLPDRLRLVGVRQDIGRLMRASDALLFPSAEEGLGMVAVEAQAAATPVLASTAIPGEAIVVPSLFEALGLEAAPEQWAERLLAVMNAPRPDATAVRAALETSDFSIVNSARRLEAVYRDA